MRARRRSAPPRPVAAASRPTTGAPRSVERVLLAVKAQATGPRAGLDRAPAGRRRVRRVAAERAQRGGDRRAAIGRDRTVGAFVNLFADVIGAGGDPRRRARRPRRRRARRRATAGAGPRGRRRPAGVGPGAGHRQRLGLPVVEARLRRDARGDRARRRPDGRADRPAPGGDARAGRGGLRGGRGGGDRAGAVRRVRPRALRGRRRPRRRTRATDALVAWLRTQAKDRSGIWRDIAVRHRPTEVPTHYRPVLAAAARHGIAAPGLERLVAQIGELEAGAAMDEAPHRRPRRGAAMTAVPAAVRARRRRRRRAAPAGSTRGAPQLVDDLVAYAERETPERRPRRCWPRGSRTSRRWLAERLGAPARPGPPRVRRARRRRGARVRRAPGDRPLTLLAHYDTVWSAGTLDGWPVRVDGDRRQRPRRVRHEGRAGAGGLGGAGAARGRRAAPAAAPRAQRRRGDRQPVLPPADRGGLRRRRRRAGVRGERGRRGEDRRARASASSTCTCAASSRTPGSTRTVRRERRSTRSPASSPHAARGHRPRPRAPRVNVGVLRGGTRSNVVAGSAEAGDRRARAVGGGAAAHRRAAARAGARTTRAPR